jgi:DtxR family Mn-dependent transcriptional regulator
LATHGLIDTTEMYLRTVFELTEEGVVPLRARIAERLAQSGPTVSETVARMERDGLLQVEQNRRLALTSEGEALATRVMRKHRLAECLLVDVIGLPWEEVHIEACRWEHVISDHVERRLAELLHYPVRCPHGNVIPGLAELGVPTTAVDGAEAAAHQPDMAMTAITEAMPAHVVVQRISEQLQSDAALMLKLKNIGIQPGLKVTLVVGSDDVRVTGAGRVDGIETALPRDVASHLFVVGSPESVESAGSTEFSETT